MKDLLEQVDFKQIFNLFIQVNSKFIISILIFIMGINSGVAKHFDLSNHTNIKIVTTIKPLYNLVAAVTKNVNSCRQILLLQGNASPHDYSLKLSDLKLLKQADLIVWEGDQLEYFLTKLLSQPQIVNKLFTVQDLKGLTKLKIRRGNYLDEHLWLSPHNAKIIVKAIEQKLAKLDPVNAKKYATNRRKFLLKLASIDSYIKDRLTFISSKNYLVFHDAYQYFEKFYNLRPPIVISDNPAIPLSVQRMFFIRELITKKQVDCLFKEPQFSSKALDSLLKPNDHLNVALKIGTLDPLGADQDMGPNGYFKLLTNLSNGFYNCFNK